MSSCSPRRYSLAWALLCIQAVAAEPRLHLVTFSNSFDPRLVLPLSTAYRHGLTPHVLGLDGQKVGWGPKSGNVLNAYRTFVFDRASPDDVVVLFDAYDVMFQGGEADILEAFLHLERRTGHQIVYNGDVVCSSPRKAEYPASDSPWRYLNGGVIVGRASALRQLYRDPIPATIVDSTGKPMRNQNWYTNFFLDHQQLVLVDTGCELGQVVMHMPSVFVNQENPVKPGDEVALGASALSVSAGKLTNTWTNTTPPILHFPGPAHWPDSWHDQRVGTCLTYEFFREHMQPDLARLMEEQSVSRQSGHYFGQVPWKPICTFYLSPVDYVTFRLQHLGDWLVYLFWRPSLTLLPALALCVAWRALRFCKPTRSLLLLVNGDDGDGAKAV